MSWKLPCLSLTRKDRGLRARFLEISRPTTFFMINFKIKNHLIQHELHHIPLSNQAVFSVLSVVSGAGVSVVGVSVASFSGVASGVATGVASGVFSGVASGLTNFFFVVVLNLGLGFSPFISPTKRLRTARSVCLLSTNLLKFCWTLWNLNVVFYHSFSKIFSPSSSGFQGPIGHKLRYQWGYLSTLSLIVLAGDQEYRSILLLDDLITFHQIILLLVDVLALEPDLLLEQVLPVDLRVLELACLVDEVVFEPSVAGEAVVLEPADVEIIVAALSTC